MYKKLLMISAFCVLLSIMSIPVVAHREYKVETVFTNDNLIRLHVIANSDSARDQNLKNTVRDEIIQQVAPKFIQAGSIGKAREIAGDNLSFIRDIAIGEIKKAGENHEVRVELSSFAFPTKHYGPFMLPAGDYEAIRVIIGGGDGSNWWCVLFPPLCFIDMTRQPVALVGEEKPAELQPESSLSTSDGPGEPALAPLPETPGESTSVDGDIARIEYRFRLLDLFSRYFG